MKKLDISLKYILVILGLWVLFIVVFVHFYTKPYKKEYYISKFENNKKDFYYFTKVRDSFFDRSKADHYDVMYTIRSELWLTCKLAAPVVFDSGCNDEFLNDNQKSRVKTFMENASLSDIVYYKDTVVFDFNKENSAEIIFDRKMNEGEGIKIDSQYVLIIFR